MRGSVVELALSARFHIDDFQALGRRVRRARQLTITGISLAEEKEIGNPQDTNAM